MQDIHSVAGGGGGGGRLFTGGGGGDRRLRPHHHHHGNGPQALKCPRCESLNTKFCYYNNYNLSQPRHFCKSCRRYWTKGGVLRNVPVGGGCRKTKRSKPKSGSNKNPSSSDNNNKKSSNSQNSSSESSSLTATTTTTTTAAVANPATAVSSSTPMVNFPETSAAFFTNPSFEPPPVENNNLFTELGGFTGLINSTGCTTQQLPVDFNNSTDISPFRLHQTGSNVENSPHQWNNIHTDHIIEEELKLPETCSLGFAGLVEKTGVGIGTEDWNNNGCTDDQALFDLTGAVDQSYWSQTWDDHGHDDGHDHHHHHQLNYLP